MLPLSPRSREDIRAVAELTSDEHFLAIAELSEVLVSLEPCRHLDPADPHRHRRSVEAD